MPFVLNFHPTLSWVLGRELFAPVEAFAARAGEADFEFAAAERHTTRAIAAVRVALGLPAESDSDFETDGCEGAAEQWADVPDAFMVELRARLTEFVEVAKGRGLTHRFYFSPFFAGGSFYTPESHERVDSTPESRARFAGGYLAHTRALVEAAIGVFRAVYQVSTYLRNDSGWDSALVLDEYEFEDGDPPTLGQDHLVREGFAETHAQARALFQALMDDDGPSTDTFDRARKSLADYETRLMMEQLAFMHTDHWDEYAPAGPLNP
jgi:hypothetical protein